MDTRIKNTIDELKNYEPEMNELLDRILDEFGLITCGWSAEWDIALRECFERCKSHRFSTYWTGLSEPTMKAKELVDIRRAEVIKITSADNFFSELNEKVMVLEDVYRPHPLSIKVAVAMLKKYIANTQNKIKLNDMIMKECEYVCEKLKGERFDTNSESPRIEAGKKRVNEYEAVMERLLHLLANGCYWGEEEFSLIWTKCIEMIADTCSNNGHERWQNLTKYPLLLMMYVGGISSIASNRFYNLYAISNKAKMQTKYGDKSIINEIYPWSVFGSDTEWGSNILSRPNYHTPISDYLYDKLKEILKDILGTEMKYDINFEAFEYFFGLIFIDSNLYSEEYKVFGVYCPTCKYKMRNIVLNESSIFNEADNRKDEWEPLKVGYFEKDYNRYLTVKEKYIDYVSKVNKKYF